MYEHSDTPRPKQPLTIDDLAKAGWKENKDIKDVKVFVKNEQIMLYDSKNQRVYSIYRDLYEPFDDR